MVNKTFHGSVSETVKALITYAGVTTADGAAGKTSLIDAALIGSNDFVTGKGVVILGGSAVGEDKVAVTFSAVTGEITFTAMSAQIVSGTPFVILNGANTGALMHALMDDVGDASGSTLGSIYAILGNPATALATRIGNPDSDTLVSLVAKLGNDSSTVKARFDAIATQKAEVAINVNAINASETDVLNLSTAGKYYEVKDMVLKCADPGANTVNVKLYKLVNGSLTAIKTFAITTANYATYFRLQDMFTNPVIVGDNIKITVQATAGGPYAVTGSYTYGSN
jgi:hypothetical protein